MLPVIGWREWVALPMLGVERIKAKVDTGARSSSLHAFDIDIQRPLDVVRFKVHPLQGDSTVVLDCEAMLLEERWIKSSNGKREFRPVIRTTVSIAEESWPIDLTLTSRDAMGFRMLLGREGMRKRFVVDPGASFLIRNLVPEKALRKKKPKKNPEPSTP